MRECRRSGCSGLRVGGQEDRSASALQVLASGSHCRMRATGFACSPAPSLAWPKIAGLPTHPGLGLRRRGWREGKSGVGLREGEEKGRRETEAPHDQSSVEGHLSLKAIVTFPAPPAPSKGMGRGPFGPSGRYPFAQVWAASPCSFQNSQPHSDAWSLGQIRPP